MLEKLTFYTNRTAHRNSSIEHATMQSSEVDLGMRNAAHSFDLRKWLKCGFNDSSNPVLCNGQILMYPNIPSMPLPFNPYVFPSYLQPWCNPILYTPRGEMLNGSPGLQGMLFYLRLSHINNISELDNNSGGLSKEDMDYGAFLGRARNITGGWNATTAPDDGAWALLPLTDRMRPDTAANIMTVYDINSVPAYMLEIFILPDGSYVVLPVTYYQNHFYKIPLRLYIPPKPPYTLLNTHLLAAYPNATVVLTDDIILALANTSSPEMVYLANPGGDAWIDHLDLDPVVGRKVICTVLNTNNQEEKLKNYRTAVKLAAKLHSVGITPKFAILRHCGGTN